MKRRLFFSAAARLSVGMAGGSLAWRASAQPGYRVSAGQLQRMLAERFPLRWGSADLFTVELDTPRLSMLPALNRVSSAFSLLAAGPALRQTYSGSFEVDFRLRYEASDRSIRAHDLRAHSFRLPGLTGQAAALLEAYAQALTQQALPEVVLHRLRPHDLEMADAMGLQPGDIRVTDEGLAVEFVVKPQPHQPR